MISHFSHATRLFFSLSKFSVGQYSVFERPHAIANFVTKQVESDLFKMKSNSSMQKISGSKVSEGTEIKCNHASYFKLAEKLPSDLDSLDESGLF